MVAAADKNKNDRNPEVDDRPGSNGTGRGAVQQPKFAMSGCHDTTLGGLLTSFGAFKDESWPPFTSHIALELFQQRASVSGAAVNATGVLPKTSSPSHSWLPSFFSSSTPSSWSSTTSSEISRKPLSSYSAQEKSKLEGHYVRIRYNDRPLTIPGCRTPGNHLDGDESFCTLVRCFHVLILLVLNLSRKHSSASQIHSLPKIGKKHATLIWINLLFRQARKRLGH